MNSNTDIVRDLARSTDATPDKLAELHARLVAAAERDGILDVAYRVIDSPVGLLLVAATERGLVRVAYASEDHDAVLQNLAERISPRVLNAPARLDAVARELDEYFERRRQRFDVLLDLAEQPDWSPARTFAFANLADPDLVALAGPVLSGLSGATASGDVWHLGGRALIVDHPNATRIQL